MEPNSHNTKVFSFSPAQLQLLLDGHAQDKNSLAGTRSHLWAPREINPVSRVLSSYPTQVAQERSYHEGCGTTDHILSLWDNTSSRWFSYPAPVLDLAPCGHLHLSVTPLTVLLQKPNKHSFQKWVIASVPTLYLLPKHQTQQNYEITFVVLNI